MFAEYILAALERAEYKVIDDPEPIFEEAPSLTAFGQPEIR